MSLKPAHSAYQPRSRPLPPRVGGLPIVGALPGLLRGQLDFLLDARARYGDIYTLDLGVARFVVCNHPRHAQHILVDHDHNYHKGGVQWDALRAITGNGLVVSEGDFWLRQRRLIQPQFHRKRLAAICDTMVAAADESLRPWDAPADAGTPLDLLQALPQVTMRVLARAIFGLSLSAAETEAVTRLMTSTLDYVLLASLSYSLPNWTPFPGRRRFQHSIRRLDQIIFDIIARERQSAAQSDSLLSMLLAMQDGDTGERMTDAQIRDEVMTFFLAGYETTSIALTWTLDFLTHHPQILDTLRAEVDRTLGRRAPAFGDLAALPYTRAVIQESMRLRSPAWWFVRTAVADDTIDGYAIPAGTNIAILMHAFHHHPDLWDGPERFDPVRFLVEAPALRHKLAWMPFGAGQRQCIGRDFSIMEAQIILALIAQRFTLLAASADLATPRIGGALKPKGGVAIYLAKRDA